MSTAVDHGHTDVEHEHPADSLYIKIALILGAITAAEVATFYVDIGKAMVPALIIMMIAKFATVAALFMHLKGDNKLFTRFFVTGIILAMFVYFIVFFTMHVFSG